MRRRRLVAGVAAAVLVAGIGQAPAAAGAVRGAAADTAAGGVPTDKTAADVTLITGDRVTVSGDRVSVRRGAGRQKVGFLTESRQGHRYVIPTDAVGLLRAGRLDERLFDVTAVAALRSGRLPLLVAYGKGSASGARSALTAGGAEVTRDIAALETLAVKADAGSIWPRLTAGAGLRPGIRKVWLDGQRKVSLDVSVPRIGAPAAWQAGYDGAGVTVAVLDTGVDATHPDLAGQIAGTANFTTTATADDEVGHGTHVASIIAGTGAASGGKYKGVAPGAKLLIGKVCETEFCDDSAILAGMAWAAERAPVVNMSLTGPDEPEIDPLEAAVRELTARHDTLFVVAAGNDGGRGTVGSPSTADDALSVGAVDDKDQLADFSSRGPRAEDHGLKPDITAPGVDIVAAEAKNGVIGDPAPVEGYVSLSGTSMATPHVAGAAAILTQEHPGWSSRLRKNTLMGSAEPTDGVNAFDQGAGRVDVAREISQPVTADEGSLSFGLRAWPHADDQPVTKAVTYRNSGASAVTLGLATSGGPFTVATSTLTVPAGGTAATTVTADTRGNDPDGPLGGHLTATAPGGVRVETPLGVDKEVESYDVTVKVVNRDGTPGTDHILTLVNFATFDVVREWGGTDTYRLRLPAGRYGWYAWIFDGENNQTMLAEPELVVDHALTVTVDGTRARPVRVTPPIAGAGTVVATVNADWTGEDLGFGAGTASDSFDTLFGAPASATTRPFFLGTVAGSWAEPGAAGDFRNSPYTVDLAYFNKGKLFAGLTRAPELRELATIRTRFGQEVPGSFGGKSLMPQYYPESGGLTVQLPFDLPFRRTEYVNTEAPWSADFLEQRPGATGDDWPEIVSEQLSTREAFRAGRAYRQDWNTAAFGPSVSQPLYTGFWAYRNGDHLSAYVPMFGNGGGYPGFSTVDSETVALYRDGTKLGDGTEYDLPPGDATYRLEQTATRSAPHTLSTSVSASWTFRSGHVGGDEYRRLPLSTVVFRPRVDDHGVTTDRRVPLVVRHQPDSSAGVARDVRVDVSFDDGRTWSRARVDGAGDHRVVTVKRHAGFVAFRVVAADRQGNAVNQTIIRAFRLK